MDFTAYPNLPGFTPLHDPTLVAHKRVSATKQEENRDYVNKPAPMYPLPRRAAPEQPDQSRMLNPMMQSTSHRMHDPKNAGEISNQYEPTFVQLDRQVLRFMGYFKEHVTESAMENYRIRELIILFYLEDETISIIEPRQMNSGVPQGAFLKRQIVMKSDQSGVAISPHDLMVGTNIMIYGKNIRLTDCDVYTREFYAYNGIQQAPKEEVPQDNFNRRANETVSNVKDAMMKDFLEHSLGGGRPANWKQFLDHDRKVLRFYCSSGEPFVLHYYLADNTIEILEGRAPNSGKDQAFSTLLRRCKLPKRFAIGQPGNTVAEEFLLDSEIEPDMVLTVFGRQFKILSADQFTIDYYNQNYARVFPLGPIRPPPPQEKSNITIPEHNGIGDDEDSKGYVYRLIPKQPKKDYFKFIDNSAKILRWTAHMNTHRPEDKDRRFIIAYFLNDDTIQIHEIPQRNSGVVEGRFLVRNKYKNADRGNEFFRPADFLVNASVSINAYSFFLEGCDEYTRKYMEETYQIS